MGGSKSVRQDLRVSFEAGEVPVGVLGILEVPFGILTDLLTFVNGRLELRLVTL